MKTTTRLVGLPSDTRIGAENAPQATEIAGEVVRNGDVIERARASLTNAPTAGASAAVSPPVTGPRPGQPVGPPYRDRADVRAFIDRMVTRHGFARAQVENLIFSINPALVPAGPPKVAEDLAWYEYRERFITQGLINRGVDFAEDHNSDLLAATRRFGVDRRAMLGIAGVETQYGGNTGRSSVLQALTRFGFDGVERRRDYFQSELEALLLLGREHGFDLRTLRGSYAGALGIPQFMPSNYRRLAVAADGTSQPNLWNESDAILSIANYFRNYDAGRQWQTGQPVYARARVSGTVPADLLNNVVALDTLRQNGVTITSEVGNATTGRLLRMETAPDRFEYFVGLPNFETIRSYNPSNNYAMAVAQLGDRVLAEINRSAATRTSQPAR